MKADSDIHRLSWLCRELCAAHAFWIAIALNTPSLNDANDAMIPSPGVLYFAAVVFMQAPPNNSVMELQERHCCSFASLA